MFQKKIITQIIEKVSVHSDIRSFTKANMTLNVCEQVYAACSCETAQARKGFETTAAVDE